MENTTISDSEQKNFKFSRQENNLFSFSSNDKNKKQNIYNGEYMLKKDILLKELIDKKHKESNLPEANNKSYKNPLNKNKNIILTQSDKKIINLPINEKIKNQQLFFSQTNFNKFQDFNMSKKKPNTAVKNLSKNDRYLSVRTPERIVFTKKPELIHEYFVKRHSEFNYKTKSISTNIENINKNISKEKLEEISNLPEKENDNDIDNGNGNYNKDRIFNKSKDANFDDIKTNYANTENYKKNLENFVKMKKFYYKFFMKNKNKFNLNKIEEIISVKNFSNLKINPTPKLNTKKYKDNELNYSDEIKMPFTPNNLKENDPIISQSCIKRFFSSDSYYLMPKNINYYYKDENDREEKSIFLFLKKKIR